MTGRNTVAFCRKIAALFWAMALAAVSCAVIAFLSTALALYYFWPEAELPPGALGSVAGAAAGAGIVLALVAGRTPLPGWLRGIALGSLVGVAVAVAATLAIAMVLGGPSKGQAPYLHVGLVYVIPVGLVVGAVGGLVVSKLRRD